MTHKIALKLADNVKINTVCSLGLPLGIQSIINTAKMNERFIALNGCSTKCSSLALKKVGIADFSELTLTDDFAIQKNKNFNDETKFDQVEAATRNIISEWQSE
jgi:uncharacterized metal-binding protein